RWQFFLPIPRGVGVASDHHGVTGLLRALLPMDHSFCIELGNIWIHNSGVWNNYHRPKIRSPIALLRLRNPSQQESRVLCKVDPPAFLAQITLLRSCGFKSLRDLGFAMRFGLAVKSCKNFSYPFRGCHFDKNLLLSALIPRANGTGLRLTSSPNNDDQG